MDPICRHFFGPAGHGKTTFVQDTFLPKLLTQLGVQLHEKEIFKLSPGSSYFSGYFGQKVMLKDEFLAKQQDDPILDMFNALASVQNVNMDGAAIELKNMKPQHEFFFTISNYARLNHTGNMGSTAWVDSVNSRLNGIYFHNKTHDPKLGRTSQTKYTPCFHTVKDICSFREPRDGKDCPKASGVAKISLDDLIQQLLRQHSINHEKFKNKLADYDARVETTMHQSANHNPYIFDAIPFDPRTARNIIVDILGELVVGEDPIVHIVDQDNTPARCEPGHYYFVVRTEGDPIDTNWQTFLKGIHNGYQDEDLYQYVNHVLQIVPMTLAPSVPVARIEKAIANVESEAKRLTASFNGMTALSREAAKEDVRALLREARKRREKLHESFFISESLLLTFQGDKFSFVIQDQAEVPAMNTNLALFVTDTLKDQMDTVLAQPVKEEKFSIDGGCIQPQNMLNPWNNNPSDESTRRSILIVSIIGLLSSIVVSMYIFNKLFGYTADDTEEETPDKSSQKTKHKDLKTLALSHIYNNYNDEAETEHQAWLYDEVTGRWEKIDAKDAERIKRVAKRYGQHVHIREGKSWRMERGAQTATFADESGHATAEPTIFVGKRFHQSADFGYDNTWYRKRREKLIHHQSKELQPALDLHLPDVPPDLLTVVSQRIKNASVRVFTTKSTIFGLNFRRNQILCNAHLVVEDNEKVWVVKDDITYRAIITYKDDSQDVMILKVESKTFPPGKDIVDMFVSENKLFLEDEHSCGIHLVRKDLCTVHWGFSVFDTETPVHTCQKFVKNVINIHFGGSTALTTKGDCGSPILLNTNTRGTGIIIGIHSFGLGNQSTIGAALVTREILESMAREHQSAEAMQFVPFPGTNKMCEIGLLNTLGERGNGEDPFEENDRIKYLGTYKKAYIQSVQTTEFQPLAHPISTPPDKIPSIQPLRYFTQEVRDKWAKNPQGKPDRAYNQLAKMVLTEPEFDEDILARLETDYTSYLSDHIGDRECRVLRDFEVVNGVASGPLSQIKGFDMTKSTGYTFKKLFNISKKKDLFVQEGDVYRFIDCPANDYLFQYLAYLKTSDDDFTPYWPSTATLKDELLPRKKVEKDGKIRLFSNVDYMQLFADKKYFGWSMGFAHNNLHKLPFTVGLDPYKDFHTFYTDLSNKGRIFTGDYSAWDKKIPRRIMQVAVKIIMNLCSEHFSPEDFKAASRIVNGMVDRIEVLNSSCFEINGSLSSGIYLTNYMNSLCNQLVRFYCISKIIMRRKATSLSCQKSWPTLHREIMEMMR
jgi:hypothetical protein